MPPAWVRILALLLAGCTILCLSFYIYKVRMIVAATSTVDVRTMGSTFGTYEGSAFPVTSLCFMP